MSTADLYSKPSSTPSPSVSFLQGSVPRVASRLLESRSLSQSPPLPQGGAGPDGATGPETVPEPPEPPPLVFFFGAGGLGAAGGTTTGESLRRGELRLPFAKT